jgi:DNA-binding NtrC family response regulator
MVTPMASDTPADPRHTLLIAEDEEGIRFSVRKFFEDRGFRVLESDSVASALEAFRASRADAVVLDYRLPDGDGLSLLRALRGIDASVPLLVLTAHGSIDLAVRAIKEGADQFLTKPVELPTLLVMVQRLIESHRNRQAGLARRSRELRRAVDPFLGDSPAIRELGLLARRYLASPSPVLIQGETGTGKGLLASWLHQNGPRAEEPFVDLNCAGLSREFLETELFGHEKGAFTGAVAAKPGLLEIAHRGTLFLDEIGDVDLQVQPKLLKVVEEQRFRRLGDVRDRQVDVRLIAATHFDLAQLAQQSRFRGDLFYRISTLPLFVPPLRQRGSDVIALARVLLDRIAADLGRSGVRLSGEAERALEAYPWPGNVRELRNVLERAILHGGEVLTPSELAAGLTPRTATASQPDVSLREAERRHIEATLDRVQGNVQAAAASLGLSRSALYQKLRKHGIVVRSR